MGEIKSLRTGETEAELRQLFAALFTVKSTLLARSGVLGSSGLTVRQTTSASGSVTVDAGVAIAQDTALNGVFPLVNNSPKTLDVLGPTPVGGVPRNDVVVFDAATGTIYPVTGTPNAVPTDPSVPATAVPLARLRHNASATTVPTANIDDLRVFTAMRGGMVVARSAADRDSLAFEDKIVRRTDTGTIEVFNGTTWDVYTPGQWKRGVATVTPDANGYATINHGAGFTPAVVNATPEFAYFCGVDPDDITGTSFKVRLLARDGTSPAAATKVMFTCYK